MKCIGLFWGNKWGWEVLSLEVLTCAHLAWMQTIDIIGIQAAV